MGYDTIFGDLLLIATLRWAVDTADGDLRTQQIDELIDELGDRLTRSWPSHRCLIPEIRPLNRPPLFLER